MIKPFFDESKHLYYAQSCEQSKDLLSTGVSINFLHLVKYYTVSALFLDNQ